MSSANSKTISDFPASDDQLRQAFIDIQRRCDVPADLHIIFDIALSDKSLFPNINLTGGEQNYERYIERWVKSYVDADRTPPSTRIATPKSSCSDPAIKTIVQVSTAVNDTDAIQQERHHILFMSAENIQGNLLEEYIALNVRQHGWLWCKGNVIRAVDFCTQNASVFLQIKNKSNTENSSSSAIRAGTQIQKWYRLGTKTVHGVLTPAYKWSTLNDIINDQSIIGGGCMMTEDAYLNFLRNATQNNPRIITDE